MGKTENQKESILILREIFHHWYTWLTIFTSLLTIFIFFTKFKTAAFFLFLIIIAALAFTLYHYYKKTIKLKFRLGKEAKRYKQEIDTICDQFKYFHSVVHQIRDSLCTKEIDKMLKEKNMNPLMELIKTVLNEISLIFGRITQKECTTSLMLPDVDKKSLKSCIYSKNATPERIEGSKAIPIGTGMAGKTFLDKQVRYSFDFTSIAGHNEFVGLRESWKNFYLSGITIPFKVNNETFGIINADFQRENIFGDEEKMDKLKYIMQTGGDLIAHLFQLIHFLESTLPKLTMGMAKDI